MREDAGRNSCRRSDLGYGTSGVRHRLQSVLWEIADGDRSAGGGDVLVPTPFGLRYTLGASSAKILFADQGQGCSSCTSVMTRSSQLLKVIFGDNQISLHLLVFVELNGRWLAEDQHRLEREDSLASKL